MWVPEFGYRETLYTEILGQAIYCPSMVGFISYLLFHFKELGFRLDTISLQLLGPAIYKNVMCTDSVQNQYSMKKYTSQIRSVILGLLSVTWSISSAQESHIIENVVYGFKDGMAMYYDVEIPETPNGKGIVYVISGGWHSGKENLEISRPFWEVLLAEGYDGAKQGLAHILENAEEFGVTTNSLGAFGISSGGHIALMLSMDAGTDLSYEHSIGTTVAIMAPAEITFEEFDGNIYGESPVNFDLELAPALSPVNFVSPTNPPTLLIHGTEDAAVNYEKHSARLHSMLRDTGVKSELISINAGHQIYPELEMNKTHEAMIGWFDRNLE